MQINLHHHPGAFPDLERAFDPDANAADEAHTRPTQTTSVIVETLPHSKKPRMTLLTGCTKLLIRAWRVSAIIYARAKRAAYGCSVSGPTV
ncbi:MAG: hypothetical protein ACPGQM_06380 [Alphaproteobacteria bacterium]